MAKGNAVKFAYISAGRFLPEYPDADTIYFLEGPQQLYVGDKLIADHIDPIDIEAYLSSYHVKDVKIEGSGSVIVDAVLDDQTGNLIFTLGDPSISISKGVDIDDPAIQLQPGDTFKTLVDTSVSGTTITDENGSFILPHQISGVEIVSNDSQSASIVIENTDGSTSVVPISAFKSAAFKSADEFASANEGQLAQSAMQSVGGSAVDAHIELSSDPVNNLDAVTKQYVDSAISSISGAMRFLGISSTPITDSGTESPTIDGQVVTPVNGDVVIYEGIEYVWSSDKWNRLGTDSSYVLKTTKVIAGEGISGGGELSSDVTLSHANSKTSSFDYIDQSITFDGDPSSIDSLSADGRIKVSLIRQMSVDKFGHVTSVLYQDVTSYIAQLSKYIAEKAIEAATSSIVSQAVALSNAYTDQAVEGLSDGSKWGVEEGGTD